MVGHTQNSTSWGTGMEQQMIGFLSFTLLPWIKRIEMCANRRLLRPDERRRFYVKFNRKGCFAWTVPHGRPSTAR